MSRDTTIRFMHKKPSRSDLVKVCEDYVEGMGTVKDDDDRLFVSFPGAPSFPFKRMREGAMGALHDERWFEVFLASLKGENPYMTVITRSQDELVNNIATGFAVLVARFWQGDIDSE